MHRAYVVPAGSFDGRARGSRALSRIKPARNAMHSTKTQEHHEEHTGITVCYIAVGEAFGR